MSEEDLLFILSMIQIWSKHGTEITRKHWQIAIAIITNATFNILYRLIGVND